MRKVVIDLKNKNALVALAYIKTNDNPVEVFCSYILYVLSKANNQNMRIDELHAALNIEFGLDLPIQMINICTNILKKRKSLESLPNGAGFHFCDKTFDANRFDTIFSRLHSQEKLVIECLQGYMREKWEREWSYDESKQHLSKFLNEQGNAASIFLDDDLEKAHKLSPSWYIGHFVSNLQKQKDRSEWKYLLDIVNGMMIYQGVYYIDDYNQNKAQKFKDTEFYLDTKLLLRYLGYSFPAQVKATQELVDLIIKEYQGKVMVFDQTISEVSNALSSAGKEYKRKKEIGDWELRGYAMLNPTGAELLSEKADAIPSLIEGSSQINRCDVKNWGRDEYHQHYIDQKALVSFIKSEHETWRTATIENDVAVINQINVLRKSDYSARYGGKNRLPVFITSNLGLVYSVKNYTEDEIKKDSKSRWNPHALPVISDNMLLFRLWVPVANKYSELPAITMSRYAYAAQNAETSYFATLKEKAVSYQKEKHIDTINISEARRSKLEEIVIKNTDGDSEQLTDEVYAMSVDEFLTIEKQNLQHDLNEKNGILAQKDSVIEEKDKEIINLLAKPHINKIGASWFLIFVARWWWLELAVILYLVAYAFNSWISSNNELLNIYSIVLFAIPLIFEIVGKIIDYCASNPVLVDWLVKPAISFASRKYARKVLSTIAHKDLDTKKAVLLECFSRTKVFAKYKVYVSSIETFVN